MQQTFHSERAQDQKVRTLDDRGFKAPKYCLSFPFFFKLFPPTTTGTRSIGSNWHLPHQHPRRPSMNRRPRHRNLCSAVCCARDRPPCCECSKPSSDIDLLLLAGTFPRFLVCPEEFLVCPFYRRNLLQGISSDARRHPCPRFLRRKSTTA